MKQFGLAYKKQVLLWHNEYDRETEFIPPYEPVYNREAIQSFRFPNCASCFRVRLKTVHHA